MRSTVSPWFLGLVMVAGMIVGAVAQGHAPTPAVDAVKVTTVVDDPGVPPGCVATKFVLALPGNRATWAIAVSCPGNDEPTITTGGRI